MAPWATANHCVMFERGYLELIGITDPTKHNPWTAFLDRFEGIHITAFRCPEADMAYAAAAESEKPETLDFFNWLSGDQATPSKN